MDPTIAQWRFKTGDKVISADNQKLGKVVALLPEANRPTTLVIQHGLLNRQEHQVPVSAVSNYADDTIYIDLSKDQVAALGGLVGSPDGSGDRPGAGT